MRLSLLPALLCACALAAPVPRFPDPDRRAKLARSFPEIERIFERYFKARGIPGMVLGIVIDGELAFVKAWGVRDRHSNDPVDAGTVFRIASMTKSFTALAMLKLRDEGKLSLDDPVSKWIPEFRDSGYATRDTAPVRLRQLLTHGAGFPEDNPWGDQQLGVSEATLTAWLKKGIPPSAPADTEFEYSNYGFALAGRVIERASKRPYREYLEKEILAPLGMSASTLEPSAVPAKIRATGYRRLPDGSYSEEPALPHGAFGAMGGLLTSANDLARYVAYMLSAWPPRDDPDRGPVRRSSLREMQRVWRTSGFGVDRSADGSLRANASGYGYGLGVSRDCRFAHIVGHGGGLPGFGSYMQWLPEYGVGVFAMANLTYAGPGGLMPEVFDAMRRTGGLVERKLPPSGVLLTMREALLALWQNWDEAKAQSIAANNLFKDVPAPQRRAEIDRIRKELGACQPAGELEPENLLRGRFRMNCERGFVDTFFTLAPTNPPLIQQLRFAPTRHLTEAARTAAEALAALIGAPAEEKLASLASPGGAFLKQRALLEQARASYGQCRLGETVGGDGASSFRVRLQCDKADVDAALRLGNDGKIEAVTFLRPAGAACIP